MPIIEVIHVNHSTLLFYDDYKNKKILVKEKIKYANRIGRLFVTKFTNSVNQYVFSNGYNLLS